MAANMEMEVKALNSLADLDASREYSLGGAFLERPVGQKQPFKSQMKL